MPSQIVARPKGEAQEIIEAVKRSGLFEDTDLATSAAPGWTLCVVEATDTTGDTQRAHCKSLNPSRPLSAIVTYHSTQVVLSVGTIVRVNGTEFSFFDTRIMSPRHCKNGDDLHAPDTVASSAPRSSVQFEARPSAAAEIPKVKIKPFDVKLFHRTDMTPSDRAHFPKKVKLHAFVARLRPSIDRMILEGSRTPDEFSIRLNALAQRTAASEKWTPRLARFLLSYMFESERFDAILPRVKTRNGNSSC